MPRASSVPTRAALALATILLSAPGGADLLSEDGPFGPDTVTHDTETGLRWLDVVVPAGVSYSEALAETEPGGDYEGWRMATAEEVAALFDHAGFDLTVDSDFVPQNYAPAMALAALVGTSATNGSCGTDCSFSFTQGWRLRAPAEDPSFYYVDGFGWFDNSAPLNPIYPQAPIGRAALGHYTNQDSGSSSRGAWLVQVPEPGLAVAAAGALAALGGLARRLRRPIR
jgi:hypothetical protein